MTSAVAVFMIIHTLHDASIEISLGCAVTLHGVHAQDASCSTVLLHLCTDGSQRCTCTLIPSTTAFSDPHLHRLSTFQVPYLKYIFHFLSHTKTSLKVWGPAKYFVTRRFFMVRSNYLLTQLSSWRATPCWCLRLLTEYIHRHPQHLEAVPSLHLRMHQGLWKE
jgi:hypothetical protein